MREVKPGLCAGENRGKGEKCALQTPQIDEQKLFIEYPFKTSPINLQAENGKSLKRGGGGKKVHQKKRRKRAGGRAKIPES